MNNFVKETVERFNHSSNLQQLNQHFIQTIQALGFSSFTHYGIRMPQMTNSTSPVQTSYNPEWIARYIEKKYSLIDPILKQGMHSSLPFVWDKVPNGSSKFMSEANEFSHSVGMTIPIHSQLGTFALLSICTELNQSDFKKIAYEILPILHFLAQYYHQSLINLCSEKENYLTVLSPREKEVLKWTAEGKTAWEISEILNIATSTVNQYIQNACKKLDASNKSHAVAKALSQGLIAHQ